MKTAIMIIIFLGNIVVIPFVNHIHPTVLSMPFFLFWLLIWMIITPILTYVIYRIDNNRARQSAK